MESDHSERKWFVRRSGLVESISNDLLSLPNDPIQMGHVFEAFGVDLIDIFCSGWASCEPARFRNYF